MVALRPAELTEWLRMAWAEGVPAVVIGRGTNILVADAGVRGLLIVNACREFAIESNGLLTAQSGALLRTLADWTVARGWEGLEWAGGIPGTIGGAVVGNCGAHGGSMADIVRWVTLLLPDGSQERVSVEDLDYGYRTSSLKRQSWQEGRPVVLQAVLQLRPADVEELARKVDQVRAQRAARTPRGRSAGSIFKRTAQYPAGFLIEQAGLKGHQIGGAQVSTKHANFLMNVGDATAADVMALIRKVQEEVWSVFAQRLEPEIEFLGEWSRSQAEGKPI